MKPCSIIRIHKIFTYKCIVWALLLFFGQNWAGAQVFFEVDSIPLADVKIFYVEDEAQCDLRVTFVYTYEEAAHTGHWCETGNPDDADVKIIFVDNPDLADINLCVAFEPEKAGWINKEKEKQYPF